MGSKQTFAVVIVSLILALGVASCGDDTPSSTEPAARPAWPELSKEQHDEAERLAVPVRFENDLGMRFVLIPAGTFLMGSPEAETSGYPDLTGYRWKYERPQTEVMLTKSYYMLVAEATNAQYRIFKPQHDSREVKGKGLNDDAQPAVFVSWDEAQAFAAWLSQQDGARTYRLPTEAEWERACRAGTKDRYWWGDSEAKGWLYANAFDVETDKWHPSNHLGWRQDDGYRVTAPVGNYQASPWGLYDMHGNAAEWCADDFGLNQHPGGRATDPLVSFMDPSEDQVLKILRGGSWASAPEDVRSACRHSSLSRMKNGGTGFRLVSPLPE